MPVHGCDKGSRRYFIQSFGVININLFRLIQFFCPILIYPKLAVFIIFTLSAKRTHKPMNELIYYPVRSRFNMILLAIPLLHHISSNVNKCQLSIKFIFYGD